MNGERSDHYPSPPHHLSVRVSTVGLICQNLSMTQDLESQHHMSHENKGEDPQ